MGAIVASFLGAIKKCSNNTCLRIILECKRYSTDGETVKGFPGNKVGVSVPPGPS